MRTGMPWCVDTSYLLGIKLHEAQEANRQFARERLKQLRDEAVKELQARIAQLTAEPPGCDFCRGLPEGGYDLKYNCGELYGLKIDHGTDTVLCPHCHRILAQWE